MVEANRVVLIQMLLGTGMSPLTSLYFFAPVRRLHSIEGFLSKKKETHLIFGTPSSGLSCHQRQSHPPSRGARCPPRHPPSRTLGHTIQCVRHISSAASFSFTSPSPPKNRNQANRPSFPFSVQCRYTGCWRFCSTLRQSIWFNSRHWCFHSQK